MAAAGDREKRRAAAAKQVAERRDDDDDRETQPDRAQRRRADLRDAGDVDAVDDIIQKVQYLRDQHRKRRLHNVGDDPAVFKIHPPHGLPPFFPVPSLWLRQRRAN